MFSIRNSLYALLFVLVCAAPCLAANWIQIGTTGGKSQFLIDISTLRRTGSTVHFFAKELYSKRDAKAAMKTPHLKKTLRSTIFENSANCAAQTFAGQSMISYEAAGDVIDSWRSPFPDYEAVIPDSIGEAELHFVCAVTQQ